MISIFELMQICRLSCKSTQFPCWPPTVSGCCHPTSRDNVWTDKLLGAARDGIHCFPCEVWWCVFVHKMGCTKHGLPRVHRGIWKIQTPPYCNWEGEYMKPYPLSLELALHLPHILRPCFAFTFSPIFSHQDIVGLPLKAPLTSYDTIYTLPMFTIKDDKG